MIPRNYYVFIRNRNGSESAFYIGSSRCLQGAKSIAEMHSRGEVSDLPEHLCDTSGQDGHRNGTRERVAWVFRGGNYYAVRIRKQPTKPTVKVFRYTKKEIALKNRLWKKANEEGTIQGYNMEKITPRNPELHTTMSVSLAFEALTGKVYDGDFFCD